MAPIMRCLTLLWVCWQRGDCWTWMGEWKSARESYKIDRSVGG